MEKLPTAVACELVEADLNLKGTVTVLSVQRQIRLGDERDQLVGGLGAYNITERNVLEAVVLANIIIVGSSPAQLESAQGDGCMNRILLTYMLMPAGIPEPANERTSREVKSGDRNLSFSNSALHGSMGMNIGDFSTSSPNARVRSTGFLFQVVRQGIYIYIKALQVAVLTVDN